jgi:hypothetical protein
MSHLRPLMAAIFPIGSRVRARVHSHPQSARQMLSCTIPKSLKAVVVTGRFWVYNKIRLSQKKTRLAWPPARRNRLLLNNQTGPQRHAPSHVPCSNPRTPFHGTRYLLPTT